jgi:hypothetical protein
MTSQLFIVKKTSTLPYDTIHITPKYVVHLHNHQINLQHFFLHLHMQTHPMLNLDLDSLF